MLVIRSFYWLKLSGAAFQAFITETLYTIGYRQSYADPDVSEIKGDGFKYW